MSKFEIRIDHKYRLGVKIADVESREVFEGENLQSGERVTIKLENKREKNPKLLREYQMLSKVQGTLGIPLAYCHGSDGDYNYIVTEPLGKDLEYIKDKYCGGTFSLKTCMMIADQITSILEYCHGKGVIHREVWPGNLCMGLDNNFFHVHLINFENAKDLHPNSNGPIQRKKSEPSLGDPMFASINAHIGNPLSEKEDIETMIYMLLYMMTGSLPWGSVLASGLPESEVLSKITDLKQSFENSDYWNDAIIKISPFDTDSSNLTSLPSSLHSLYKTIRNHKEGPLLYSHIRSTFRSILLTSYLSYDYIYDWVLIPASKLMTADFNSIEPSFGESREFTYHEEQEIQRMIEEYEKDPSAIDMKLQEIKAQVQHFEIIKLKKVDPNLKSKGLRKKVLKRKNEKAEPAGSKDKGKDCALI